MAKKLYQVFVSSTFDDLKEERREVLQTVIGLDCVPAGMELFAAADEEQFSYIKRVIDICDYYIVIVGGRYGSVAPDGRSFTEKEFDYAIERGIPVLAFVHGDPASLPPERRDPDSSLFPKLQAFRERVMAGRMARPWSQKDQLPLLVFKSLSQAINEKPGVGWIRADSGPTEETLKKLLALEEENRKLHKSISELQAAYPKLQIENLAPLDGSVVLRTQTASYSGYAPSQCVYETTWLEVFGIIGPTLFEHTNEGTVATILGKRLTELRTGQSPYTSVVDTTDIETVRLQLLAHGLIAVESLQTVSKTMALFWVITDAGKSLLMQIRTVKVK
jgi:hypothetical protein